MRRSACPLAVLLLLLLSLPARADGEESPPPAAPAEIWRFSDGEMERVIDVTTMPAFVRAALEERLATQGFVRLKEEASDARDLQADVKELVRNQGRFPAGRARRARDLPPEARRGIRAWLPSIPSVRVLGAPVSIDSSGWRLALVPAGSMAAALGLRPGDRIVALDGRPPTPIRSLRWATAPARRGKLTLLVRRREGRTSKLALTFVPAAVE